jgi:quercetin dioxygenase-like cupin family protein
MATAIEDGVLAPGSRSPSWQAGDSWSEPPGAIHSISRDANKTEPARLLAIFVLDTNDNPLTTPIK